MKIYILSASLFEAHYKYSISYVCQNKKGSAMFGHCTVTRNKKIRNGDDLDGIAKELSEKLDCEKLAILSWKRFE